MIEKTDILPQTFRKLNTALELRFTTADDDFFVDIHIVRLKTGLIVRSHYIILPDLPQWIGVFEAEGWQRYNSNRTTEGQHIDNEIQNK